MTSAATGEGISDLAALIRGLLQKDMRTRNVVVDDGNGALIHWLYENTEVLRRHDLNDGSLQFEVRFASEKECDLDRHLAAPRRLRPLPG